MENPFNGIVRALSLQGLGIVDHPEGMVFFVRGAWPGDEGSFEIESLKKRYGFAKLHNLVKPSLDRRTPPCPHLGFESGKCGGCPWMIATYEAQIREKDKLLKNLFQRLPSFPMDRLKEIWPSEKEFSYRNRTQFKTDGKRIGYVSPGTKEFAPIEDCMILTDKNRETLEDLKNKLPNKEWEPSTDSKWKWNFIEINESIGANDIQLNQHLSFQQGNTLQNERMKNWLFERLSSVIEEGISKNNRQGFTLTGANGGEWITSRSNANIGKESLNEVGSHKTIGVRKSNLVIKSREDNFEVPHKEKNQIDKKDKTNKNSLVGDSLECLELFSGNGNFTEVISALSFNKILSVEFSSKAIEQLNKKTLKNVNGMALDIYSHGFLRKLKSTKILPQILVLDPPREGYGDLYKLLQQFPSIQETFYISCDPYSFSQDLKKVIDLGFAVQEIQPVDQFANTHHIELLSWIRK